MVFGMTTALIVGDGLMMRSGQISHPVRGRKIARDVVATVRFRSPH